jgi:large repetitive protein
MRALAILALAVHLALAFGCGARTGLFSSDASEPSGPPDGGGPAPGLGCPYTSGVQAGAPWPMKGRCPDQDSRGAAVVTPRPREIWKVGTGGEPGSPVVGADGTAYVTSGANLLAVSPGGDITWRFAAPAPLFGSPALARDGSIYVVSSSSLNGSGDTAVEAVSASGGSLWTHDLGPDDPSSPVLAPDGTIYVSGAGVLHALLPADGSEKWRAAYPTNGYASFTSPAVGPDGTIYVGLNSLHNLVAITPAGAVSWHFDIKEADPRFLIGADIFADPVVGPDGTVYIASGIEEPPAFTAVFAVRADGTLRWTHDFSTSGDVAAGGAIARDGSIVFVNDRGTVASFRPDGQFAWSYETKDVATSLALGGDGTAYVGGGIHNALYAIGSGGMAVWSLPFGGSVGSPVVTAGGGLLVPTSDGYLHAVGP